MSGDRHWSEQTLKRTCFIILILALILIPVSVSAAGSQYRWGGGGSGSSGGSGSTLTADEVYWLNHMREEEKLARDTYRFLYRKWGMNIFYGISNSEQRHMDAVKTLLDRYGIPDPAKNQEGVFTDLGLQNLYDSLTKRGIISPTEALKVGVDIEVLDIDDLTKAITVANHNDIENVYSNLRDASYNHLNAFQTQLGY
jgi:Uncharacterized protein conserved in archaea